MARIGRPFLLTYGHPEGCSHCGEEMFEKDKVAFVDDKLTCSSCIEQIQYFTVIGRKARLARIKGRK